jgi:glycosyltransferase 2 family protein
MFAEGLGYDVSIADLLPINISVSLLASFIPIPGGIGVAELGLTVGLAAIGMPDQAALATALLYRVATFYLPPVWGFFALRWLRSKDFL